MSAQFRVLPVLICAGLGVIALKAAGLAETATEPAPAKPAASSRAAPATPASAGPASASPASAGPAGADAGNDKAAACSTDGRLAAEAGLTQDEFKVLQALGARREALDAREADIDTREKLVEAAGKKIEGQVNELKQIKAQIDAALSQIDDKQDADTDRLVKVYEKMKPKDAAFIFNDLDDSVLINVAAKIKDTNLALILSQMRPEKARALTVALSRRAADKVAAARDAAAKAGGG